LDPVLTSQASSYQELFVGKPYRKEKDNLFF